VPLPFVAIVFSSVDPGALGSRGNAPNSGAWPRTLFAPAPPDDRGGGNAGIGDGVSCAPLRQRRKGVTIVASGADPDAFRGSYALNCR
jgi:hypothetical protein